MVGIYLLGMGLALYFIHRSKRYRKYAVMVLIGSLLALCMRIKMVSESGDRILSEISRQEKSGRGMVIELEAEIESETNEKIKTKKGNSAENRKNMQIEIGPQSYTPTELEMLECQMWETLKQQLLGKNQSVEYITENLYFPENIEGYPFLLTWSSNPPRILTQDGRLGEEIPEKGILVEICLRITVPESMYEKERRFYGKVFPSKTQEAFWKRLEKYIADIEKVSRDEESYILPDSFEGRELRFRRKTEDKSSSVFLLFLIGTVTVLMAQRQEEEKEKKLRLVKIEQEYAQMAVRMAMLVDTGMTISGAFKRIAADYGKKRQKTKKPLYEEMLITCREMESGIPETTAYQNMGKRCQASCMIRFTALLVQYSKSGVTGLKKVLQEEAEMALRERKEYVRKKGEEAGTKLLVPMMLMLVLVMVVIMIPAFTSFGV